MITKGDTWGTKVNPYLVRKSETLNLEFSPRGVELVALLPQEEGKPWKVCLGHFSENTGVFVLNRITKEQAEALGELGIKTIRREAAGARTIWVDIEEEVDNAENGPVPVRRHEEHP